MRWQDPPLEGEEQEPEAEKIKPNYALSGKLAAETNTFKGVVLKYNEPPEAKQSSVRWRLYPLKGEEMLEVLYVHRQSAYLIGRDQRVCACRCFIGVTVDVWLVGKFH